MSAVKSDYSKKLLDPRWQRKRLEILQRDNFTCTIMGCMDNKSTLHVHHLDYIPGKEPWDYPDNYLTTLCVSCHDDITRERLIHEKKIISQVRLKLKDTFIQMCCAQLFEKIENLHDLVYLLWELKDDESLLNEALANIFRERDAIKINEALNKSQ